MIKNYVIFVVVLALVVGGAFVWLKTKPSTPSSGGTLISTPTPALTYQVWNDPAGFTFEYPNGVNVDNHPNDQQNYANLTLTAPNETGEITVLMQDDTYKALDKWAAKFKDANILDTTLDGKDAKKVLTTDDQTIIGIIDTGVLVTLTKDKSVPALLETAWSKLTDSWVFVYPTPAASKSSAPAVSDDSGDILEEY